MNRFALIFLALLPACAHSARTTNTAAPASRFAVNDLVTIDLAPLDAPPGVDRLTARIESIDSSGRLHLAAKQTIIADEHSKITELTADADPRDISANNAIASTHLARLRITTTQARP